METAKLTVRLPKKDIELAKQYARDHRMTVTERIRRQLRSLRGRAATRTHPEVERISGLIPSGIDARAERREHLRRKHG